MSTLSFIKKQLDSETAKLEVEKVVSAILEVTTPKAIFLFGSAAQNKMTDQSDIDLLLLFKTAEEISIARKSVSKRRPISDIPLDLVWMTEGDYKRKSKIGGLAQIIFEEGSLIFGGIDD